MQQETDRLVTLTMDGQEVQVPKGTMLLEIARKLGIHIPTLCYHEALTPYGACRLCLVEVIRRGRSRITTSCTYPAEEGIEVLTHSERVLKNRKLVVELLLARAPNAAVIQDLARELGVQKPRFRLGEDDCILCGLCVRACEEQIGVSAISFAHRGADRSVDTPFHIHSDACIGCGACATVCPTGAIRTEDTPDGYRTLRRFNTTVKLHQCEACGRFYSPDRQLQNVKGRVELSEEWLSVCPDCRRGKFAFLLASSAYKLTEG